jgi:hypothetical protein
MAEAHMGRKKITFQEQETRETGVLVFLQRVAPQWEWPFPGPHLVKMLPPVSTTALGTKLPVHVPLRIHSNHSQSIASSNKFVHASRIQNTQRTQKLRSDFWCLFLERTERHAV